MESTHTAVGETHLQPTIGQQRDGAHGTGSDHLHTEPPGAAREGIDDALRVLRGGEDAMVGLHHEGHALPLKPRPGIIRPEDAEEPLHEPVAARIDLPQVGHAFKRVGEVAPSAPRHRHFGQHAARLFIDGDRGVGGGLLGRYGRKEAGRPTSDDGNV